MKIIYAYITKEILHAFVYIIVTVVAIFMVIEFSEKIDNFIDAQIPQDTAFVFFQCRIPFIVAQVLPIGLLLGIIIALGLMNKSNEILALRCNGVNLAMLIKPVLAVSVVMALVLFLLNDILVPITVTKSNRIWNDVVNKGKTTVSSKKNIWLKDEGNIYHIKFFDQSRKVISGVTLYYFGKGGQLERRIDARSGRYAGEQWTLREVMHQRLSADNLTDRVQYHDELKMDLGIVPQDLQKVVKKAEEMTFIELLHYIDEIESAGYDATAYKVDLQDKIAFPMVCIILGVAAAAVSIRRKVKENMIISIGIGIGIIFLYFIFHNFCLSLGYGDILPYYIAPWVANFIFLGVSGIILLNSE